MKKKITPKIDPEVFRVVTETLEVRGETHRESAAQVAGNGMRK
jgi:hypothetical protein